MEGDCIDSPNYVDGKPFCTSGFISVTSIANKRDDDELLTIQVGLNLVAVVLIILFFHYIRYQLRKVAIEADDRTVTPSDYTIKVAGIPKNATDEEIKVWIQDFSTVEQPIECRKIVRAHNIKGYAENEAEKDRLRKEIKSELDQNRKIVLEYEIQQLENEWKIKLEGQDEKYTSKAFVTLTHAHMADFFKRKFRKTRLGFFFNRINPYAENFNYMRGERIKITRAPEPNDIIWENLGYVKTEKIKK